MGYLPAAWLTRRSRGSDYRLYMRAESDGLITVGLKGTEEGLRPVIDRYGRYARHIQVSSGRRPDKGTARPAAGTYYFPFTMSFDRPGLERAAALALLEPPRLEFDFVFRPNPFKPHPVLSKATIGATSSATMISR